jgi:hypothetical protein
MRKQQDAIKTEQENKVQRVKSLEQISAILDELEISDMSNLDEEKKKALYAKLFSEDRSEEIEDEIIAKGKEKDASDEVGNIAGKAVADEVDEDESEDIEDEINKLGEPKKEDPKDGEELESKLDEANVTLDAMEPTEKSLVDFCKKKGIKWKVINQNGPAGGWPEVEYVGKKKDLEEMIKKFWEGDGEDSGLAEFINEARSINKIQNDWSKITAEMAKHAAEWKAASAEDKPAHLEVLKGLTAKKKALEAELDDAVTGKDKDLELVVTEGNAFTGALFAARNKGEKTFEFNGKTYKVHSAKVNEKNKEIIEGNAFGDAVRKAKEAGEKEFEFDGKTYKVEEGNAFGDAVRKAKEAGEKEFEFDGKTYKVEEALTEGAHGMATKILQSVVNGDTSRAEGTKMSKGLAAHYLTWVESSPFGKKNANLPLNMLIKASFNWGIERGLDPKLKVELAALKDSVKEALVFEGAVKQFEMDYKDMETNIKRGIGWIDPDYVADTWENSSDSIDFELVKAELYKRLLKAGLLWYSDEYGEEKEKQVKSLKELGIKESLVTESHFKLGDKVKCKDSGKTGEVVKLDKEDGADDEKYYTVKVDGGGEMKYAPDELELMESKVTEAKIKSKSPNDDAETDIDFAGSDSDLKRVSKKYNLEVDEYEPGMVMLKGKKKDILAYLQSPEYDMDSEDIKDLFSELLEAEIKSDDEFKEYAMTVLKKAFGADFDEAKAGEVVDGILTKCDGDYGACVGMLTSSLGESKLNESATDLIKYVIAASEKTFKGGGNGQNLLDNAMELASHIGDYQMGRPTRGYEEDGFYGPITVTMFKKLIDQMSADDIKNNQADKYESVVTEKFDANYWEDYHEKSGKIENPNDKVIQQEVEASVEEWNDNNEDGEDNEVTSAGEKKVLKLAKEFVKAKGWISSDIIDAMIAQES